jgi:hypothetical protein
MHTTRRSFIEEEKRKKFGLNENILIQKEKVMYKTQGPLQQLE